MSLSALDKIKAIEEKAAQEILAGIQAGEFDIHFPKRFSRFLKFLRILPYPIYFWILRNFVKI